MTKGQARARRTQGMETPHVRHRVRGEDGEHPGLRKARLVASREEELRESPEEPLAADQANTRDRLDEGIPEIARRWAKMRLALLGGSAR